MTPEATEAIIEIQQELTSFSEDTQVCPENQRLIELILRTDNKIEWRCDTLVQFLINYRIGCAASRQGFNLIDNLVHNKALRRWQGVCPVAKYRHGISFSEARKNVRHRDTSLRIILDDLVKQAAPYRQRPLRIAGIQNSVTNPKATVKGWNRLHNHLDVCKVVVIIPGNPKRPDRTGSGNADSVRTHAKPLGGIEPYRIQQVDGGLRCAAAEDGI